MAHRDPYLIQALKDQASLIEQQLNQLGLGFIQMDGIVEPEEFIKQLHVALYHEDWISVQEYINCFNQNLIDLINL